MRAIFAVILAAALAGLAGCETAKAPADAAANMPDPIADFATYCADCHGAKGRGNGPAAAGLDKRPADLTRLSDRNGGTFPTTRVMSQIWGYAGGKGLGVMPSFAPMMQGALIPYDGGDGIETPTPERLVALAEYVKAIQD